MKVYLRTPIGVTWRLKVMVLPYIVKYALLHIAVPYLWFYILPYMYKYMIRNDDKKSTELCFVAKDK